MTKAITLHRPWPYAIAYLGKNIENRSWPCPLPVGTKLGIHAGKKWDQSGADWIMAQGLILPPEPEHETGIICTVNFKSNIRYSDSRWFFGEWGWLFEDKVSLLDSIIKCSGKQGLWNWDEDF